MVQGVSEPSIEEINEFAALVKLYGEGKISQDDLIDFLAPSPYPRDKWGVAKSLFKTRKGPEPDEIVLKNKTTGEQIRLIREPISEE